MQDVRAAEGDRIMMIAIVIVFALAVFGSSFLIAGSRDLDNGKLAVYASLVAWGSLLCGLYMAKTPQ